jgi:CRISPR/Cas system-associated endonuclease Cas1
MQVLTVTAAQAQFIAQAGVPLVVVDEQGKMLGHLTPATGYDNRLKLSDSEFAEIKRRMQSSAPGLTTAQVLGHLRTMEES